MRISIANKIIIVGSIIFLLLMGGLFLYITTQTRDYLTDQIFITFKAIARQDSHVLWVRNQSMLQSIDSLTGTPPFQGIYRSEANNGIDPLDGSTREQWVQRLEQIFSTHIQANGALFQLRLLDTNGQEQVRVNRYNKDEIMVVSGGDLQNKYETEYVQKAVSIDNDEVYISSISLNREGAPPEIELPYRPVIRYVKPIVNETTGERGGYLIANVSVTSLFSLLDTLADNQGELWVVDYHGYYIEHPNEFKLWGSPRDLNTGVTLSQDFPLLVDEINQVDSGVYQDDQNIFAFEHVHLNPFNDDASFVILRTTSSENLLGPMFEFLEQATWVTLLILTLLVLSIILVVRRVIAPLFSILAFARIAAKGDLDSRLDIDSNDEFGLLSESLNTMADNLSQYHDDLSGAVNNKTKELNDKLYELEDTKAALMNVLDDAEQGRIKTELEKEKLTTVLKNISEGLVVLDEHGHISLVNNACLGILGLKEEGMVGHMYTDAVPMFDASGNSYPEEERLTNIVRTKPGEIITNLGEPRYYRHSNGHMVPVHISVTTLPLEQGKTGVVQVFRDISKDLEIDKAKNEFVSLASHQLRTPLTATMWYTEMLRDDETLNEEQKEFVKEIERSANRMISLVNALLDVSRIELGTFSVESADLSLPELIDGVVTELRTAVDNKKQHLEIEIKHVPETYYGDRNLLQIIFQNLLTNAIKYTQDEGTINLKVEVVHDQLLIEVADNGHGIPKAQQGDIFKKLFRADNIKTLDTTGTGLGLYIIKAIIEQSRGSITFESEEGKGTTFRVYLPLSGMKDKQGSRPLKGDTGV